MDPTHAPTPFDYPTWINDRIRAELKARRLALGLSAYALAIPRQLTDQTILNIEHGTHSPSITTLALLCLFALFLTGNFWFLLGGLLFGYGFAWIGHFGFEKNRPASFKRPLYSFRGDWVMWRDILTGRIPL